MTTELSVTERMFLSDINIELTLPSTKKPAERYSEDVLARLEAKGVINRSQGDLKITSLGYKQLSQA